MWILLVLLVSITSRAADNTALLLSSCKDWSLANRNRSLSVTSCVPGYALDTLQHARIINDPLYRENELQYRWVSEDTWTFSRNIQLTHDHLIHHAIELVFEGLDTVADVSFNGHLVLQTANFHRYYTVSIKNIAVVGENSLEVVIHPAVEYAYAAASRYPYDMPSNPTPMAFEHYNFIRKPASDSGWDWGPAFAPAGIHGDVTLLAYTSPILKGVHVQQEHAEDHVTLSLECEVWVSQAGSNITLSAELPDLATESQPAPAVQQVALQLSPGHQFIPLKLEVARQSVDLWWPNGMGAQLLYQLHVTLAPHASASQPAPGGPLHPKDAAGGMGLVAAASMAGAWEDGGDDSGKGGATHSRSSSSRRRWATGAEGQPGRSDMETPSEMKANMAQTEDTGEADEHVGTQHFGRTLLYSNGASEVTLRIGFRTVELVTEPLIGAYQQANPWSSGHPEAAAQGTENVTGADVTGESFFFRVNGVPLFVQGANFIPLNIIHTRSSPNAIRDLLDNALAAHFNMIRVWGGGLYQRDELYEYCDVTGLLVWQEFMYACAPYPLTSSMLQEAESEAAQVMRRLGHHASIAIWGGNNEVEASFDWYEATRRNPQLYAQDFYQLFIAAIYRVVQQLDPGRPWVDSSPSNGVFSRSPYIKRWGNAQDPRFGDVHFYSYDTDCRDPSTYPPAKFVSEYGYQSAPSFSAVSPFTEPEDWDPLSEGARFRQRHPDGDAQLQAQLERHFRLPTHWGAHEKAANANASNHATAQALALYKQWIYLTQVQQALCYETALTTWKRQRIDPAALTMGVLYWQLNDIWPGYSWSSINYGGLWKPLHYVVARTFGPVAALSEVSDGVLQVFLSSSVNTRTAATLSIRMVPLWAVPEQCGTHIDSAALTLEPLATQLAWRLPVSDLMSRSGCSAHECYASVTLQYLMVPPEEPDQAMGSSPDEASIGSDQATGEIAQGELDPDEAVREAAGTQQAPPVWQLSRGAEQQPDSREARSLVEGRAKEGMQWRAEDGRANGSGGRPSSGAGSSRGGRPGSAGGSSKTSGSGSGSRSNGKQVKWWLKICEAVSLTCHKCGDTDSATDQGAKGSENGTWATGTLTSHRRSAGSSEHVTLQATPCQGYAETQVWFAPFRDMMPPLPSPLTLQDWEQVSATDVCFTARARTVLPLLVLEANIPGRFSDNMITLDPCSPRRLCFSYTGDSQQLDIEELKDGITWESLATWT